MTHHLAEQIPQIYERHALEWDADRNRSKWIDQGWHERFIACLPERATVFDLGCGSGRPVAQYLVQHGFLVTGVDTSPTLIALCRRRMPEQEWIVADMRTIELERRFDGILGWDSFFFLTAEAQRHMFTVFATHAAPSAFLMFNTGTEHGVAIGEYRGNPLYHSSLDTAEYQTLLDQHGFQVIEHVVEDSMAGGRTIWLAQSRRRVKSRSQRVEEEKTA
ncbi:MAG TPA: class I SAM-dependent methyltransferase [Ktedonobacterales bacterium]|nr:class I SAM-dependent methyltransferase [Ktedonobacterales bacterium]